MYVIIVGMLLCKIVIYVYGLRWNFEVDRVRRNEEEMKQECYLRSVIVSFFEKVKYLRLIVILVVSFGVFGFFCGFCVKVILNIVFEFCK